MPIDPTRFWTEVSVVEQSGLPGRVGRSHPDPLRDLLGLSPGTARLAGAVLGAAVDSDISGQSLGFLLVLDLPLSLGRIYAGSDLLGTAAVLGFYLYLSHVIVLSGYALMHLLDARGGWLAIAPPGDPDRRPASRDRDSAPVAGSQGRVRGGRSAPESCPAQARLLDRG